MRSPSLPSLTEAPCRHAAGSLELTEANLLRWLRPEAVRNISSPFAPKLRGLPGTEQRLPEEIREQQKRIRNAEPPAFLAPSLKRGGL